MKYVKCQTLAVNQHNQAWSVLQGQHSKIYESLRSEIIKILAASEAFIEFEEEEFDVKKDLMAKVGSQVKSLIESML